jgi:hypothetical protein
LNRRSLLHEEVEIDYDPLAADPDYLVVGQFAWTTELYASVIEAGEFSLIEDYRFYRVYERVREE